MRAAGQNARPSEGHLQALVEIESVNLAAHHSVMILNSVRDTERTVVKYSQMSLEILPAGPLDCTIKERNERMRDLVIVIVGQRKNSCSYVQLSGIEKSIIGDDSKTIYKNVAQGKLVAERDDESGVHGVK
ncbi:hypothetical protein PSHT_09400 [Puccinia striiformis]|uniref:Uncharacterized protein n=1 Tax=Puccinia striiformis TaxID=27350 RepID=A0A2S4VH12_9BASI|nr:hypothetical protein PSHT_09400 [Puccinia striiformis]